MDHQLKLTARGHAVCELMTERGLSLDAACARVEQELETLRGELDRVFRESTHTDVASALEAALSGVSARVQRAYLEELELDNAEAILPNPSWQDGAMLH